MPYGTAYIMRGYGIIKEASGASASFLPQQHPAIVNGMYVYFNRDPANASVAINISPVASSASMIAFATPDAGMTAPARALVADHVLSLFTVMDGGAPTARDHQKALKSVRKKLAELKAETEGHGKPVGVAIVRSSLEGRGRRPSRSAQLRRRRDD